MLFFTEDLTLWLVFFRTEWGEGSRKRQLWECGEECWAGYLSCLAPGGLSVYITEVSACLHFRGYSALCDPVLELRKGQ